MVKVSEIIDNASVDSLPEAYREAHEAWEEGWVAYSPRLRKRELLERYRVVGNLLSELDLNEHPSTAASRRIARRAIANARSTLAHFMRGDEPLPPAAFPEPLELVEILGAGDGTDDSFGPLKKWLSEHPGPAFHPSAGDQA